MYNPATEYRREIAFRTLGSSCTLDLMYATHVRSTTIPTVRLCNMIHIIRIIVHPLVTFMGSFIESLYCCNDNNNHCSAPLGQFHLTNPTRCVTAEAACPTHCILLKRQFRSHLRRQIPKTCLCIIRTFVFRIPTFLQCQYTRASVGINTFIRAGKIT